MPNLDPEKLGQATSIMKTRGFRIGAALAGIAVLTWILWGQMFVTNDAGYDMVIQNPISGTLDWSTTPGLKFRMFGRVTVYPQRETFWFSSKPDQGKPTDEALKIRFNDGGHATMSGSISWELPADIQHLTALHNKFRGASAIDQALIRTVIEKSVYTAGPMMSSTESYAARRNELLAIIEDQINNGVFETETYHTQVKDAVTGETKWVDAVRIKTDADGHQIHATDSPLSEFGIKTFNLSMNDIKYDDVVEAQIKQQQEAVARVQIALAQSKQAQQDAITAEAQGQAAAAKAKWEKEVIKAAATVSAQQDADVAKIQADKERQVALIQADREKQVALTNATRDKEAALTLANRDLEVATLAAKTADQKKQAAILEGEGQAKARTLILAADGALQQKIDALVKIQGLWANAFSQYKGNVVPGVIMGGNANGQAAGNTGVQDFMNLMTANALKDLQLKLDVPATAIPVAPAAK